MKKILFFAGIALLAASCTEDYADWAGLQRNAAEEAKTVTMKVTPTAGDINLAAAGDSVQLFAPSVAISEEATTTFNVDLTTGEEGSSVVSLVADNAGRVLKSELQDAVVSFYGARPVPRAISMAIAAYTMVNGQSIKNVASGTLSIIPEAPEVEQAYYITGNINNWDNKDTTYKLTNDGSDPYANPTYTLRFSAPEDGGNIEFKLTPESGLGGDWGKCLAAGSEEGKFNYNNDGGNLIITAVPDAVYYDLVFNMLDQTWSVNALVINIEQAYYFTGSINGWNNTDTTYKLTNDGSDPYANPTFKMRIPAPEDGGNVEFKMTPESGLGGDWSKCLASGKGDGTFAYNNGGDNLVINAVEGAKYYDVTFNMMDLTWSYKAVNFNPFIYFIGATDGWANADQKLAHQGDGVYTGYCYVADPNEWGLGFKFQRVAGSWDNEINAGTFTTKTGVTGDNNIEVAEAGVYYFTVDLANASITAMKVTNMNLVGDFNGWNAADDAQQMQWDAENFCYVITGAGVTDKGWKFTTNNSWDVNLGGDLSNLEGNGPNISAVGTTIKLYPTRKTSDNIYCTVE